MSILTKIDNQSRRIAMEVNERTPVGMIMPFAGNTIPNGWLLCDGALVSRSTYASLYSVIGDTYGAGDGSTTFALPDLINKFVEGDSTSGTSKSAGLPEIEFCFASRAHGSSGDIVIGYQGVTVQNAGSWSSVQVSGNGMAKYNILRGSNCSSIYSNSTTVQPESLTMQYLIKY